MHLFFAIQSYAFVIFLNILDFLGITWILLKSFGFFAIFWSGEHFIIFWSSYDHFDKLQKWNWFLMQRVPGSNTGLGNGTLSIKKDFSLQVRSQWTVNADTWRVLSPKAHWLELFHCSDGKTGGFSTAAVEYIFPQPRKVSPSNGTEVKICFICHRRFHFPW